MELLSEAEARRLGLRFLGGIYYRGKITIRNAALVKGAVYHLEGTIQMSSRGALGRLVSPQTSYTFTMQIDAVKGSIISYEVR